MMALPYLTPGTWRRSPLERHTVFERHVRERILAYVRCTVLACGQHYEHQIVFETAALADVLAWHRCECEDKVAYADTFGPIDAALVRGSYLHYAVPFAAIGHLVLP